MVEQIFPLSGNVYFYGLIVNIFSVLCLIYKNVLGFTQY